MISILKPKYQNQTTTKSRMLIGGIENTSTLCTFPRPDNNEVKLK